MRTKGLKLFTLKENGRLQKATAKNTARNQSSQRASLAIAQEIFTFANFIFG